MNMPNPISEQVHASPTTAARTQPPFRAEHVGSFLRPKFLLEAREKVARGEVDVDSLHSVENDAIRAIVKFQEQLGFRGVTDGELRRTYFHTGFLTKLDGVAEQSGFPVKFYNSKGELEVAPPALVVTGKIRHSRPIHVNDFQFLKSVTKALPKLTIPSPTLLHTGRGRFGISKQVYPDIEEFFADVAAAYAAEIELLADAGCTYLQLDDTHLAYLCDPNQREFARQRGDDPDALPRRYVQLINQAIAKRPPGMTVCIHLCRGNYRSSWAAEGGYEPVAEVLFNELAVDGYFLEYDDARSGDFQPLRYVPRGKTVVLGLVSTKLGQLEKKDDLKRRIDEAAKFVPMEQLCLSPQCGFSSEVHGNDIRVRQQEAKCRLVIETAREVWPDA